MRSQSRFIILYFLVFIFSTNPVFSQQECYTSINENNTDIDYTLQNCPVDYSFRYFNVGGGPFILIPNIGVGYRERHVNIGKDIALSVSSIGFAHQLGAYVMGHYYLSPQEQNSFYFGCGVLGSYFTLNDGSWDCYLSPNFAFGKEFKQTGEDHHFLELHITAPSITLRHHRHCAIMYIPLIYIKYGMSF